MHNILKFKIDTSSRLDFLRDINFFFSYFETEKPLEDIDIILNIGKFTPSNENCILVDNKYWIRENYFYCKDGDGRAKWEVEILGFEHGKTIINFNSKVFGIEQLLIPDYLAQNMIVRPLIELKLLEKGYVSIHGLGIETEGSAYIFVARGGAHKTRIAMDLIKDGEYQLIGDDRIILGKNCVLSYPLYFNLVRFRADNLKDEHISKISERFKMLKYLNSKKNKEVELDIIAEKSKLRKLFLTARKCDEKLSSREISIEDAVAGIVSSSKMEMMSSGISSLGFIPFFRYMLAYSFVYPESRIAGYWFNLRDSLKENLGSLQIFQIELPQKYSQNVFKKLSENSILMGEIK